MRQAPQVPGSGARWARSQTSQFWSGWRTEGAPGARKGGRGGSRSARRWARSAAGRWRGSGGRPVVRARWTASGVRSRSSQAATPGTRCSASVAEISSRGSVRRRPERTPRAVASRSGAGYAGCGTAGRSRGPGRALPVGGAPGLRFLRSVGPARLVAGHRAGDDAPVLRALAGAAQVAVGLQLAQGAGDPGRPLGEPGGQAPDVDGRAAGERLDVHAESDGQQRQLGVLGEVVADHREAGGVTGVVVDDPTADRGRTGTRGALFPVVAGRGVRARVSVLGIHREGSLPRWSGPRFGIALPAGADACLKVAVICQSGRA